VWPTNTQWCSYLAHIEVEKPCCMSCRSQCLWQQWRNSQSVITNKSGSQTGEVWACLRCMEVFLCLWMYKCLLDITMFWSLKTSLTLSHLFVFQGVHIVKMPSLTSPQQQSSLRRTARSVCRFTYSLGYTCAARCHGDGKTFFTCHLRFLQCIHMSHNISKHGCPEAHTDCAMLCSFGGYWRFMQSEQDTLILHHLYSLSLLLLVGLFPVSMTAGLISRPA